MAHDLFISYSSKDKAVADAVCVRLEQHGGRCWIAPRDARPGERYAGDIVDAIRSAKVMVLVFSGHANASEHVANEVELAMGNGVVIVPFRIEDVEPSGAIQYHIGSRHWLDAMTPPLERRIDELMTTVRRILGEEPTAPEVASDISGKRGSRFLLPVVTAAALLAVAGLMLFESGDDEGPPEAGGGPSAPAGEPFVLTGQSMVSCWLQDGDDEHILFLWAQSAGDGSFWGPAYSDLRDGVIVNGSHQEDLGELVFYTGDGRQRLQCVLELDGKGRGTGRWSVGGVEQGQATARTFSADAPRWSGGDVLVGTLDGDLEGLKIAVTVEADYQGDLEMRVDGGGRASQRATGHSLGQAFYIEIDGAIAEWNGLEILGEYEPESGYTRGIWRDDKGCSGPFSFELRRE